MPAPCGAFLAAGGEDYPRSRQLFAAQCGECLCLPRAGRTSVFRPDSGWSGFFTLNPRGREFAPFSLPFQKRWRKDIAICALSGIQWGREIFAPTRYPEILAFFTRLRPGRRRLLIAPIFPPLQGAFPAPSGPKAGQGSAQYSQVPFWAGRAAAGPRRLLQRPAGSPGWEPCTGKKLRPFPNGNGRKGMS